MNENTIGRILVTLIIIQSWQNSPSSCRTLTNTPQDFLYLHNFFKTTNHTMYAMRLRGIKIQLHGEKL